MPCMTLTNVDVPVYLVFVIRDIHGLIFVRRDFACRLN
jgi:hypothetical protein